MPSECTKSAVVLVPKRFSKFCFVTNVKNNRLCSPSQIGSHKQKILTAIPAFGFEGHFTAAVSRGPSLYRCTMLTAQFYLQTRRRVPHWCDSKAACRTPVPLQRLLAKFARNSTRPLFFSKCFHTDDEFAVDSSIGKTGYFSDFRLFCVCASGTNNSNNETVAKFKYRWTNTFIRIFDLFVSSLLFRSQILLAEETNKKSLASPDFNLKALEFGAFSPFRYLNPIPTRLFFVLQKPRGWLIVPPPLQKLCYPSQNPSK